MSGWEWTNTLVSGGVIGVEVKSYNPWTCKCAESLGFTREERSKFKVMFVYKITLPHCDSEKLGSAPASQVLKCYLFVRTALSACFICFYGVDNW